MDRAKEVGIKKVVGIYKKQLILQFLKESLLLNAMSVALALAIVFLTFPYFSNLLGVPLSFTYWNIGFILLLVAVFITGTLLSALYPAFILSSFNPVYVLKGKYGVSAGGVGVRKAMLCFQFFISAMLIFLTLVLFFQTKFLLKMNVGMDIESTLVIKGSNLSSQGSEANSSILEFKEELRNFPDVSYATSTNCLPANGDFLDDTWSDVQVEKDKSLFVVIYADYDYLPAFQINLVAGRNFSKDFPSDKNAVIISEFAIKHLGFKNADEALLHKANREHGDRDRNIIGVISDIKMGSLQKVSYPVIMHLRPEQKRFFAVKLNTEASNATVDKIGTTWKKYFGDELFRWFSLEDSYLGLYKNEVRNARVLSLFTILAIIVACTGLWGLASFIIKQRTKEVGIRKVIGYKTFDIVKLINTDFIKLVLIACCVAVPLAWYISYKWLESYVNRIEMKWWFYILPFMIVVSVTVLTISYYTIKTSLANPVNALKYE
jgi:putative ABC transport system permease protein